MSTDKLVTKSDLQDFYSRILPYLGGTAEAGFTPIGTIIAVMGNDAPANYLACNGQIVNIADYPELATYFEQQFGSSNYFGGDGTTTFGIVDLSGEFLRGTGTNSHSNQGSGANVGVHQDGTESPNYTTVNAETSVIIPIHDSGSDSTKPKTVHPDSQIVISDKFGNINFTSYTSGGTIVTRYTSRPTNTSVLFCIATKNIYLNPSLDFSTSEKVVGTWVDGKTIYQKTIETTFPTGIVDGTTTTEEVTFSSIGLPSIDTLVGFEGVRDNRALLNETWGDTTIFRTHVEIAVNDETINISSNRASLSGKPLVITVRYTKTSD